MAEDVRRFSASVYGSHPNGATVSQHNCVLAADHDRIVNSLMIEIGRAIEDRAKAERIVAEKDARERDLENSVCRLEYERDVARRERDEARMDVARRNAEECEWLTERDEARAEARALREKAHEWAVSVVRSIRHATLPDSYSEADHIIDREEVIAALKAEQELEAAQGGK